MTGLLYQDFCTIKGKWILRIMVVCTLLAFAVMLLGGQSVAGVMLGMLYGTVAVFYGVSIPEKLFISDEKSAIRTYTLSLPTGDKNYVASKYVFMGIYYYVMMNLQVMITQITAAGLGTGEADREIMNSLAMTDSMMLMLLLAGFFVTAIEYPFLFAFGGKAARYVKTAVVVLLFFGAMAWVLFDPRAMADETGFQAILDWGLKHNMEIMIVSVLMPAICVILYYLSYKCSVSLFRKRRESYE